LGFIHEISVFFFFHSFKRLKSFFKNIFDAMTKTSGSNAFLLIFLSSCFFLAPCAYAVKASRLLTVAVAEFRAESLPVDLQVLRKSFPDALITELGRSRAVRIVEKEFLEQILAELKFQESRFIDESSKVQVGRLLGARVFISGSLSMLNDNLVVRARLVSVENAEMLGEAETVGARQNILGMQKDLARQISYKLALQAAFAETAGLEVSEMTIAVYKDLERLRELAKKLPGLGLDPARSRRKSDYLLALSLCDKIIDAYPKTAMARYYRALFSLHNEDFDLVDQESLIARSFDANNVDNLLLRGNLFFVLKDLEQAAAAFREVTEEFPEEARAWYALGRVLAVQGDKLGAVAAYLAAMERAPAIIEAETNLQTLLSGSEGLSLLAQLANQKPGLYGAASVLRAFWNNDRQLPADLAEKAVQQFPDLHLGYYMQGLLAASRKQYDEAASFFETCLSLRPSFAEVHRELGLLALQGKRCDEGEQHITIYVRTANFVNDYAELEKQILRCKKRK
jgi:tetratricopeptide (TPR) repeat protein